MVLSKDVFLLPGEVYFGHDARLVKTVLGSCVAVVIWHPRRCLGGMCHFVLPSNPAGCDTTDTVPERYCEGALRRLYGEVLRYNTNPAHYRTGVYGGGHTFSYAQPNGGDTLGMKNVGAAQMFLAAHGFRVSKENVGGAVYRNLSLDVQTGAVRVSVSSMEKKAVSDAS